MKIKRQLVTDRLLFGFMPGIPSAIVAVGLPAKFQNEGGRAFMKLLEERILKDGKVLGDDILKVDMFLNHQIDVGLLNEIGKEFRRRFQSTPINKILTIEASGIGIACIAAQYFSVPVVFAKKGAHRNVGSNLYTSEVFSFTKNKSYIIGVSRDFLGPEDHVLVIDDFLANGRALIGLKEILDQAGASLEGVGIVIEKGFQPGGKLIRSRGIRLESLAIVESMKGGRILFAPQGC